MYSLSHTDIYKPSISDLFKYSFIVSFSNDSGLLLWVVFQFHSSVQQTRTHIEINSLWVVGLFSDIKYTIGCGH